jgi:hypothetical protein
MKKNVGIADRIIRIILAFIFAILVWQGTATGIAAIILGILAILLVLTGVIGICPLYSLLKISTDKKP